MGNAPSISRGTAAISKGRSRTKNVDDAADTGAFAGDLSELLPALVWSTSADGSRTESANARWREYTGRDITAGDAADLVHPADRARILDAWQRACVAGDAFDVEYRIRRRDGAYRWHAVRAMPARDAEGRLLRWHGAALDIDEHRRSQIALTFLDRVSDMLGLAVDVRETLQGVAESAVPSLADWCTIALFGSDGSVEVVALAHRSPEAVAHAWRLVRSYPPQVTDPIYRRALRGESLFLERIPREVFVGAARDPRHLAMLEEFDVRTVVAAPLVARGVSFGIVQFVSGEGRALRADDVRLAEIVGKRIGVAIDNAQIYERERHISRTFQHAALSHRLPLVPGLDLHAVYVAAEREAEVGGDWYDAFTLDDGRIVISIGDVAGKGLGAAVLMGSLRQAIRVVALQGFSPGEILAATSRLLHNETDDKFATAFVGIIDPATWTLAYATAAHPSPLLRRPDGSTFFLHAEPSPPLGLIAHAPKNHALVSVPAGSLLVLYTDGLVEATRDIFLGEERLSASVASEAVLHSGDPAKLIRDTVLHDGVHDDVAVLTVAFGRSKRWSFDANDAMSAHGARSSFLAALRAEGDPHGDYIGSEVIFGELIGNVVRHAPGPIDVTLDWSGRHPVLHVIDRGPGFARVPRLPENVLSESGRGLFIIDTFARDFSAVPVPGRGTHVTVSLPVRRNDVTAAASSA